MGHDLLYCPDSDVSGEPQRKVGHDLLYCPDSDVLGEPRRKLGHDLLYCPDPDMLGEPRTERKWVKGGEIQGAVLNLDDHIG